MITVEQIMEKRFLAVRETDRVGPVLEWMDRYKVGIAPVLNEKKKLVGMIREKQLYQGLFQQEYDPLHVIENIIDRVIITVSKEEHWIQAAKRLRIYNLSAMPVVEDGYVIGMVTQEIILDHFIVHSI
ncbi:MAG: CBS domain-containing protein [Epulopiscium sp.]|nr:CBS domain-containing protein [Candidatus Epulonipiscium sp.]